MFTKLLLVAIIISCNTLVKGFAKFHCFSLKINSKTKLNIGLTSSCFDDDDENRNNKQKKNYNLDYGYAYAYDSKRFGIQEDQIFLQNNKKLNNKPNNKPLYTLVWYNCEECKQLLRDVKRDNIKILYIDGSYYFFDENDETNTPLFYKNDELIATDLFGIYEELFYNNLDP